jgi:mediator of RNA polymerase II transcription subunit 13
MSSTFPTSYDNFNSEGPNDDLFDDMDEDGFGGDGVTDADFNFFDEPGEGDIDMHDAPEAEREPAPKIKDEKEDDVPEISEDDLMQEAHDPMAALADALVSVASTSIEEKWSKMMTNASTDRLSDTDSRAPQPGLLRGSSGVAVKKEPATDAFTMLAKSALSRQTSALSTPITENQHAAHRNSIFAPITFGQEVSLSDAKYHSGRFAVRHEPVATAAENVKTSMKQSRSLRDLPLNVTKLRYALGVSANSAGRQPPSLADSDDETSDSASDKSFISDDEGEDVASLVPGPLSVASINTMKRKLPTDGSATPLSATSFAESFGGDRPDHVSVQTDILHLTLFEPTRWDWPLTDLPPPTEIQSVVTRSGVPAFSPLATSMPGTPTSQADQSLTDPEDKPLSRNDSIAVAQVVTDQIISATLDILHEDSSPRLKRSPDSTSAELQIALKDVFPKVTQCNLAALASIADVYPDLPPQVKAQQRPPPRKPNEGASLPGSHILPIQPPFVRMRRSDTLWEFLPPALGFWDSLGLGPCSSAKNVGAVCIYPHSDSLKPCLQHFLLNLRIMYEGCRLGNHELVDLDSDSAGSAVDGLVPWTLSHPSSTRAAFRSLRDTCTMLGRALSAKYAQEGDSDDAAQTNAVVIYMVNPFRDPTAVWELCSAFWSLFQAYGQGSSAWMDHGSKPDVVLQIVPIEYVASFDVPVILSASTYATLAREVYDRCPPSAPSEDRCPLSIYAAPSFQLEESIPRRIDFRLQADAPQDLLRENSYIHIGYSISLDGNWVTAAWTDTCGKSCTSVSYNLGTRAFIEVANEIWQTTVEMCQVRKVTWRVCIARCGVMEREEHEAWHYFSTLHTPVNLFIMVLTVDPNPPLKFTPTVPPSTGQTGNPQPAASTPASTPKAGISPDPQNLTPAATPAAEPASDASGDTEARLVDVTDETWGIILAHRVHNTNSTVEFRPSLISGLLVKRGLSHETSSTPIPPTPDPECGPIAVGVNILWVSAMTPSRAATSPFPAAGDGVSPGGAQSPGPSTERDRMSLMWTPTPQHRATAENLLKEILTQYRGLGTLARLKGIRGSRMGTVPWHIAVAKRGVEGMVKCFPASAS